VADRIGVNMLSALGMLVTLFLGLVGWRIQLIGKRRTELAEEALLAFAHAIDALASIRAPMSFEAEYQALRKELGEPPETKLPGESFRVTLWRLGKHSERFAEMRRLQLLCRYHFGEKADAAFEQLHLARHRVWVGAHMGATSRSDDWQPNPENRKLRRGWEAAIWAGVSQPDEILDMVNTAQRSLEAMLRPHLRADEALLPVAVSWRAGKAWFASRRKAPAEPPPKADAP